MCKCLMYLFTWGSLGRLGKEFEALVKSHLRGKETIMYTNHKQMRGFVVIFVICMPMKLLAHMCIDER